MNRKGVFIGVLFIFILCVIGLWNAFRFNSSYKVVIKNESNTDVYDIEISFKDGNGNYTIIENIDGIKSDDSFTARFYTDEVSGENSVVLRYEDSKGEYKEEILVGYLEKGYSGKVIHKIKHSFITYAFFLL